MPGLDVDPDEAGEDGVLQVGDLHRVTVPVTTEQLNSTNTLHQTSSLHYTEKYP